MSQRAIHIEASPGTTLAENKDEARRIRRDEIAPAISRGEEIVLDFEGVELATQSFIHALISEPVRRHGNRALDLIDFRNCSEELRQVILAVVDYTLLADEAARAERET